MEPRTVDLDVDAYGVPAGPERRAILRARGWPVRARDFSLAERKILLLLPPMTSPTVPSARRTDAR